MRLLIFLSLLLSSCTSVLPTLPSEVQPRVRWWWMGSDVDSTGLEYHLKEFKRVGLGGVEITPIYGVQGKDGISYLSERWKGMYHYTHEWAERLGIQVDMNAGTGWPYGGPEVSLKDAACKVMFQRFVVREGEDFVEKFDAQGDKDAVLECVMGYFSDGKVEDLTEKVGQRGIFSILPEKDGELVALYRVPTYQLVKRAAPGGEGYVLNPFEKESVLRYLSKFEHLDKQPFYYFNDSYEVYGADWTPGLRRAFLEKKGYKLEDHLREFISGDRNIITDYREVMGELLLENFTQTWTEWAHKRGAKTRNQAHGSPANLIDQYAAVDVPEAETFGITDFELPYLRRDSVRKKNDGDPTVLKFASSAAHLTGKKITSAETFTWLTEHFRTSLSQCKPEIDQLFCAGINQVYFHGSTYSPPSEEWPGWKFYASVDMSPTNNLWEHMPAFFRYVSRVQGALQASDPDNDFLLYFPIHAIWAQDTSRFLSTFPIHGMRERLPVFGAWAEYISSSGYDLDYISDYYLSLSVGKDGRIQVPGGARYQAVFVPDSHFLPIQTLEHLNRIKDEGGKVIFLSGKPSAQVLQEFSTLKEAFKSDWGGQMIRKRHDKGHLYFMSMLRKEGKEGWLPLSVQAKSALIYDPLTGKMGKAKLRKNGGKTEVYMQFEPGQSYLLYTYENKEIKGALWQYWKPQGYVKNIEDGWELAFSESSPQVPGTFQHLGSWTDLPVEHAKKNMGAGVYRVKMDMEEMGRYRLELGEVRESARVKVNGQEVGIVFSAPYHIEVLLNRGINELEVEVRNLPANRIRDLDQNQVPWRKFKEINFVDLNYRKSTYAHWPIEKSGLIGPVRLVR